MTKAMTERKANKSAAPDRPTESWGLASLNRLRREFDDLWNQFFTDIPALWNAERTDLRWAFDVDDQPDAYLIKAEAPGFKPDEFDVELRGQQLILRARKSTPTKEGKEESFTSTEFYRSLTLPNFVDQSKITATYEQGILNVTLPKTPEAQGRKISVKG